MQQFNEFPSANVSYTLRQMRRIAFALITIGSVHAQQADRIVDRRVERAKGYHIIARPARTGETPPEIKQEKAEEDRRRGRNDTDISNQTIPTRDPEIKPKDIKP